jgi:hypothetical protein
MKEIFLAKTNPLLQKELERVPMIREKKTTTAISANMTWPKKVGILHCGLGGQRCVQRMWKIYY